MRYFDDSACESGDMNLWEHTPAELRAMPLDALAMLVLDDFGERGWNVDSYFKKTAQSHGEIYNQPGVAPRIAEAWAWLEAHVLIGRHPTQDSPNARKITEGGRDALKHGLARLRSGQRLSIDMHPSIATTVRTQFLMGEFELAAFAAMRQVEIRVRHLGKYGDEQIGVGLMAAAFSPKGPGPLADPAAELGEQEAMMALYRGAIGTFKNPSSHRAVDYDDPILAAEVVLLADLLLRLLDRVEARIGPAS
jgi:uncharacterized protein (TIGR02391 family)